MLHTPRPSRNTRHRRAAKSHSNFVLSGTGFPRPIKATWGREETGRGGGRERGREKEGGVRRRGRGRVGEDRGEGEGRWEREAERNMSKDKMDISKEVCGGVHLAAKNEPE